MRLLAIVPGYPPASPVGAWMATHGCLAHLAALGHDVHVVPYLASGYGYIYDGVRVHPGADPEQFDDVDVVLAHLGGDHSAARFAARRGLPLISMVHGTDETSEHRLQTFPPDLVVFNSHHMAASTAWDGESIVVHPPFDPDLVRVTPGDLVTLVNLSENKGGEVLAELARRMPDVSFLGVRGGYGVQVDDQPPNVEVIDATLRMGSEVYSRTRVLIMPSEQETWGMVGLEAMVSGIPVVAHPTEGLRESLGPAGIFVDRSNVGAWVAVLRYVLGDGWPAASAAALARAGSYSPSSDLEVFADAVEGVAA